MAGIVAAQLSEVQQAFVQFCSVLQELILNHQVAHSVLQSLHSELPALQPDGAGSAGRASQQATAASMVGAGGGISSLGNGGSAPAQDVLNKLAPRLTPAAAASTAGAAAGPSPAAECAENYIVLQNAARRSRELLGRMEVLRGRALEAIACDGAQDPSGAGVTGIGNGEDARAGSAQEGPAGDGGAGAASFEVDVEVDLDLEPQTERVAGDADPTDLASAPDAVPTDLPAVSTPGAPAAAAAAAALTVQSLAPMAASPVAGLTTPTAAGRAAAGTTAAAAAAAAGAAEDLQGGSAHTTSSTGPRRVLRGPDLAILMGELCRGAEREVELLVRVAAALDLRTTPDDLYVYDMMLKLQPYTDERVVAAALAQRDIIAPPPPASSAPGQSSRQRGR